MRPDVIIVIHHAFSVPWDFKQINVPLVTGLLNFKIALFVWLIVILDSIIILIQIYVQFVLSTV